MKTLIFWEIKRVVSELFNKFISIGILSNFSSIMFNGCIKNQVSFLFIYPNLFITISLLLKKSSKWRPVNIF